MTLSDRDKQVVQMVSDVARWSTETIEAAIATRRARERYQALAFPVRQHGLLDATKGETEGLAVSVSQVVQTCQELGEELTPSIRTIETASTPAIALDSVTTQGDFTPVETTVKAGLLHESLIPRQEGETGPRNSRSQPQPAGRASTAAPRRTYIGQAIRAVARQLWPLTPGAFGSRGPRVVVTSVNDFPKHAVSTKSRYEQWGES